MSCRLRPLHTCGVSFLIIAHSTCSRVQNLDGRLGSTARKLVRRTKLLNPLVFVMQYLWLLFLSSIDDRLLAIANIMEKNFPPFKPVFDKIDDLLRLIQTFPRSFDDAVEKLPCFNQVLLLEWAVTHAICLLKSMMSILMSCGRDDTRVKEILVDVNYNKGRNESESVDKSEYCSKESISCMSETQASIDKNIKFDAMKRSYIEVLKMGTKGEEDDDGCNEKEKGNYRRSLEEGTRDQAREDKIEESVQKAEGNDHDYEGILSDEENSKVKDCEYDDSCRENENGTYKRTMEDKQESEKDKYSTKKAKNGRTNAKNTRK